MDALFHSLLTFILLYRYAALFAVIFVGSLGVPMPSGAILVASFFFATEGYMNVWLVAAVGLVSNVTGDIAAYWLGRAFGERLLKKLRLGRLWRSAAVRSLEAKATAHPFVTVIVSRFTTTVTPIVTFLVGIAKMPVRKFLIADIIGEAGEVALNFVYGAFFGANWVAFSQVFGTAGLIVLTLAILLVTILWNRVKKGMRAA